ncbi:hypothetical protein BDY24DRAFT_128767 [Mrakia frigida]|uniref:uncharacterized protein n=1 Tax=Mrakia frigida TaxID=29902 RepID=UPI003FCC11E5
MIDGVQICSSLRTRDPRGAIPGHALLRAALDPRASALTVEGENDGKRPLAHSVFLISLLKLNFPKEESVEQLDPLVEMRGEGSWRWSWGMQEAEGWRRVDGAWKVQIALLLLSWFVQVSSLSLGTYPDSPSFPIFSSSEIPLEGAQEELLGTDW